MTVLLDGMTLIDRMTLLDRLTLLLWYGIARWYDGVADSCWTWTTRGLEGWAPGSLLLGKGLRVRPPKVGNVTVTRRTNHTRPQKRNRQK